MYSQEHKKQLVTTIFQAILCNAQPKKHMIIYKWTAEMEPMTNQIEVLFFPLVLKQKIAVGSLALNKLIEVGKS